MLIPANEFLKVRKDDYDLLKRWSIKNSYSKCIDGEIENVLVLNYIFKDNIGSLEESEYGSLCQIIGNYADDSNMRGYDGTRGYFDLKDKIWCDASINNICGGFDHVKNYKICKEYGVKNNIKIIDGFLILEAHNGKINSLEFDTVGEMLSEYFTY
jgi:hypothetical protein